MEECFVCGAEGDKVRLFDAISDEGIAKICEKCSRNEDIPVIKRPTTFQLKEAEQRQTIHERLSKVAGIQNKFESPRRVFEEELKRKQEVSLKEIVDARYKERFSKIDRKPRPDLVENFHWIIMRARRAKKLMTKELAKQIGESETAIKMAERGVLPEDDYRLINKLENFLGVKLIKKEREAQEKKLPTRLNLNNDTSVNLTIGELKDIEKQRKVGILKDWRVEELSKQEDKEKEIDIETNEKKEKKSYKNKNERSNEEINRMIFGK